MIKVYNKKIKVCANCRYLKVIDKGVEFEKILDSEYIVFECTIRGWTVREDYLMKPYDEEKITGNSSGVSCPFWEEYTEDDAQV